MLTKFDKAISSAVLTGGASFAAFTSSCSTVFAIFGTHSATAQIASAALLGVASGVITYLVPNKSA